MDSYSNYTGKYCSVTIFSCNHKSERTEVWEGTILAQTEHGVYLSRLCPEMVEGLIKPIEKEELFFPWGAIQKISFAPLPLDSVIEQTFYCLRDIQDKCSTIQTCIEADRNGRNVVNGLKEEKSPQEMIKFLKEGIGEVLEEQRSGLKGAPTLQPHELKRIIFILEKQAGFLGDIPELCNKTKELIAEISNTKNKGP
jgi:hypothetical protein